MHEYVALGILIFTAASLLFGAIAIVGIPYKIAVDRNHPHQDAIRFAGWVSLYPAQHLAAAVCLVRRLSRNRRREIRAEIRRDQRGHRD
jgi:hypothetical protein